MRKWKVALGISLAAVCCCSALATDGLRPHDGKVGNTIERPQTATDDAQARPLFAMPEKAPAGTNPRLEAPEGDRLTSNTCSTAYTVTFDPNSRFEDIAVAAGLSWTCPNFDDPPSCNPSVQCSCIWYKFVAIHPQVKVTTCEEQIMPAQGGPQLPDSAIGLYNASDPGAPCVTLTEIACNDDFGCLVSAFGPTYDGFGSEVTYNGLTVGKTYYVQVCFTAWCSGGGTVCPYAEGNYRLRIYNKDQGLCNVTCNPNATPENELDPCTAGLSRINEGCNVPAGEFPRFSPILCNAIVCGTSYRSNLNPSDLDQDWYRLVLPPGGPYTINWKVTAEFPVTYSIIPAGTGMWGCDELPAALASISDTTPCNPTPVAATATVNGGVYFLTVNGDGPVTCKAEYQATVTTTGCLPPTGACCVGATCTDKTLDDCNTSGGSYYGDGSTCATVTCYVCPPGATPEGEAACNFPDSYNAGCFFDNVNVPMSPIACGETVCGNSGTRISTANERDSDFYYLDLPTGNSSRVTVEALAQFPIEVILIDQGNFQNPCSTFQSGFKATKVALPGQLLTASYCFVNQAAPLFRDVWILTRVYKRGAPAEVPCADTSNRNKYWLKVTCAPCDVPGACCLGSAGCTITTFDACLAGNGAWGGEASTCADICCPCQGGEQQENEPNCGNPTLNDGCWDDAFVPPGEFGTMSPGVAICGNVSDESNFDQDWYVYNHPGGLLRYAATSDVALRMLILIPETNDPNTWCADSLNGWERLTPEGACDEYSLVISRSTPGPLWIFVAPRSGFDAACPSYYRIRADSVGACCIDGLCVPFEFEADCLAAGGTYKGDNSGCDPQPCCDIDCTGTAENEPACGLPTDTTNFGCSAAAGPYTFGTQLATSGAIVCGTSRMAESTVDPNFISRDLDWYTYTHTGGDLVFCWASEFPGDGLVFWEIPSGQPGYDPNTCAGLSGFGLATVPPGDCLFSCLLLEPNDLPAGVTSFYLLLAPDFDSYQYDIACGSEYEATVASGVQGACCIGTPVECFVTYQAFCLQDGGTWKGNGTTCDPNPCAAPPICRGDVNCDGARTFKDIDPFVARLGCPGANPTACATPPTCAWVQADMNDDGVVSFKDIDGFVAKLGQPCP